MRGRAWAADSRRWPLAFVVLGLVARTTRWLLDFPFWGDESNLALNFLDRGFTDLLAPLDHAQVAPLGFLAAELLVVRTLGIGEVALRVVPWVASVASVLAFWYLTRVADALGRTLPALATTFAVAIFAVSHYLVRYGSELKPYACDLLAATVVLTLAAAWLRDDERAAPGAEVWLWLLAALALPLLVLSYPAVLVFAAVGAALAPRLLRGAQRPELRRPVLALAAALLAGFVVSYAVVGRAQRSGANLGTDYLERYWAEAFPPHAPRELLGWLFDTHTGLLFAYPNGGRHGGSIATVLLFAVGVAVLARGHGLAAAERRVRRELLALLLAPFAVGLAAAALRLYPYGGHLRLTLYLAPSICLLAGIGLAALLPRLPRAAWRAAAPRVALVALFLVGIGDVVADVARPYRDRRHADLRHALVAAAARVGPADQLISLPSLAEVRATDGLGANFEWYLRTRAPGPVRWGGMVDRQALAAGGRAIVVAPAAGDGGSDPPALVAWRAAHPGLAEAGRAAYCLGAGCRESLVVLEAAPRAPAGAAGEG